MMSSSRVPFDRYPGVSPLFLEFLRGPADYYPDRPTLKAAARRGKDLLGRRALIPASAFAFRHPAARAMAEDLASGRAVAVVGGHQVGLFTGPLFTLLKAFDTIRVARQLSEAGVPAVPIFFALTDDHDLEEIARTARPAAEGPQIMVLEGADRSNRRPVGPLPIPPGIAQIVEAFRGDAGGPQAREILDHFASRSAPGVAYGHAFLETLLDLVEPEPLLVLDPLQPAMRGAAAELFRLAVEKWATLDHALRQTERRLRGDGKPVPVPYRPDVFPFFAIAGGERRRVEDPAEALAGISRGSSWASADVLTRPILKSFAMPVAATVLGAAEIAYHAQALPLFPIFGLTPPVLLPRSHMLLLGPRERRTAEALGLSHEELLSAAGKTPPPLPQADELTRLSSSLERELGALEPGLLWLDPTLVGALETTRRKVAYQLEQLRERMTKAAEKKDEIASSRRRRLATMLLPGGAPADRLYPPLVPLLAYGDAARAAIREAACGSTEGAAIVDLGTTEKPEESRDAG